MAKSEKLFYKAALAQKKLQAAAVRFQEKPNKRTYREVVKATKEYYKIGSKLDIPCLNFAYGPGFVGMK